MYIRKLVFKRILKNKNKKSLPKLKILYNNKINSKQYHADIVNGSDNHACENTENYYYEKIIFFS